MAQVSSATTTVRLDLGQALNSYDYSKSGFIADVVAPPALLPLEAGEYFKIDRARAMMVQDNLEVAQDGSYLRSSSKITSDTYTTTEKGLEEVIRDKQVNQWSNYFNLELAAAQRIQHKILLNREITAASTLFNTTTWATGNSDLYTDVGTAWASATVAQVLTDVANAKSKVEANSGRIPTHIIIERTVFNTLKGLFANNGIISYSQLPADDQMVQNISALMGLQVVVARGIKNTASEEVAASNSSVWSASYAQVLCVNSGALTEPATARRLVWQQDCGNDQYVVESYREEAKRSNVIRCRTHDTFKVLDPYFAHLMKID